MVVSTMSKMGQIWLIHIGYSLLTYLWWIITGKTNDYPPIFVILTIIKQSYQTIDNHHSSSFYLFVISFRLVAHELGAHQNAIEWERWA